MEKLIKKAKAGDADAMEQIINKFNYFVIKYAAKYKIPSYDLDDLVQHGFLSIIKAVYNYKPDSNNFTTYCNNSIINNFNALLKAQIKHYREVQNEDILDMQPYDFTLEDEVIAFDEAKKVVQAFNKLDETSKKIIKGVYFEDKSLKEVAATYDINYRKAIAIKKASLKKLKFILLTTKEHK